MAVKNRPGSAKETLRQQQAAFRRGAPGKKFIGDTAEQSRRDHRAEIERAARMAEVDGARRVADETPVPVAAILAELVQDSLRLARTLWLAPFRIAQAMRRPREA
jgi:hypothetical protein